MVLPEGGRQVAWSSTSAKPEIPLERKNNVKLIIILL